MAKVLITGTGKGMGYDTTLLLARAGHQVVATMRDPGASDLAQVATAAKLPVTVLPLDKVGESIDVLVNNAGIYSITAVEDESFEQFRPRDGDELLKFTHSW
jgi:NAD(P)-dependent dehydrogenase (short-subunit alcohol dehydrogenase family)